VQVADDDSRRIAAQEYRGSGQLALLAREPYRTLPAGSHLHRRIVDNSVIVKQPRISRLAPVE
jgi:hypothetical protein